MQVAYIWLTGHLLGWVILLLIFAHTSAHVCAKPLTLTLRSHILACADAWDAWENDKSSYDSSYRKFKRIFSLLKAVLVSSIRQSPSPFVLAACLQLTYRRFIVCWSLVTWLALCSVSRPWSEFAVLTVRGEVDLTLISGVKFISMTFLKHRQSELQGEDQGQIMIRHNVSCLLPHAQHMYYTCWNEKWVSLLRLDFCFSLTFSEVMSLCFEGNTWPWICWHWYSIPVPPWRFDADRHITDMIQIGLSPNTLSNNCRTVF